MMKFKVINRHRHSASPLVGEVGSVEPPPSAAAVVRAQAASLLFIVIVAVLLLGAASGAWSAPIPGLFIADVGEPAPVPAPGSLALFALAAAATWLRRRIGA
jgi:hypothetical protein